MKRLLNILLPLTFTEKAWLRAAAEGTDFSGRCAVMIAQFARIQHWEITAHSTMELRYMCTAAGLR